MKKIKWDECEDVNRFAVGDYPPENGKMLLYNDNVEQGMNVSAIYKGMWVHLKINKKIGEQKFSATVLSIEGHNELTDLHSEDIVEEDIVEIERQYICCLSA